MGAVYEFVTGKSTSERGASKVKGIINVVNDALGIDALTEGVSVTKGLLGKKNKWRENTKSVRKIERSIDDQIESLKKLKELLDCGILTQEEFDIKKKRIMGIS